MCTFFHLIIVAFVFSSYRPKDGSPGPGKNPVSWGTSFRLATHGGQDPGQWNLVKPTTARLKGSGVWQNTQPNTPSRAPSESWLPTWLTKPNLGKFYFLKMHENVLRKWHLDFHINQGQKSPLEEYPETLGSIAKALKSHWFFSPQPSTVVLNSVSHSLLILFLTVAQPQLIWVHHIL